MIRVVIADDQHLVRRGFELILAAEPDLEVVGVAATGEEAVERSRTLAPDVVLMDVRMPEMDGIAATRAVVALPSPPRVLVLTTFDLDEYVFAALTAGASGFLLKDVKAEALADAIRVIHAGESLLAPSAMKRLMTAFASPARTSTADRQLPAGLPELTQREREVLVMIAHGLSNREIAERLVVAQTTVKTHVGRVLAKLDVRDRAQAVVVAFDTGLVRPRSD